MTAPDELLTTAEVSEWLRTPQSTLTYWRKHDAGPPYLKLQRRVLYRRASVAAWLASCEQVAS